MDAGALSRALGVKQRVIESHMEHVGKSVGRKFEVLQPWCADCGYKFKDRSKSTKPSRCPMCKSEMINPPRFFVNE